MLVKKMDQEIFNAMLKKIITIAAFVAIAAGCAKVAVISAPAEIEEDVEEIPEVTVEPSSVVFTAGIDTKAYLDEGVVKWSGNESITIWNGTVAAEFTTKDNGSSATFSTAGEFTETGTYTALYPHDGGANFSDLNALATTIPASQVATAGSFDPAANLAVASSTTTDLTFYNLVSYLKFTVPSGMTDLTSVSFSGNNSEKVAGAATVNVSTKALSATGSDTATLTGTFAEGSTYYLAIAPQEFTTGYTVTITRSSGSYTMVSSKDVTFSRSKARNIGDLWDGEPVIVMSGTALDSATEMTAVAKPAKVTNNDNVFTFRGDLKSGKLTIKEKYSGVIVASDITIPADGSYHVMYNKTSGRLRVYSQDIMTHLGKSTPMDDGNGTYYYPEHFTLNDFTNVGNAAYITLKDYNGNPTGAVLSVDSSTAIGTWKNDNENVFGNGGDRATNSPFVDDDYYPSYSWGRPCSFINGDITANSADVTFTISGLDNSAKYDVRVCGIRYSSSANLRVAVYAIGDTAVEVDNGLSAAGTLNLTTFKTKIVKFDSISPDSGTIALKMHSVTKHRDGKPSDFSEAYICSIYISKVVYSQN